MEALIDNISEKIAGIICSESQEMEIITYGVHQTIIVMLYIFFIVISGIIWNERLFLAIMFVYFSMLRPYVGGYHAETEGRCLVISIVLVNLVLFGKRHFALGIPAYTVIWLASMAVMFLWAPIGSPNKEFDMLERRIYKRKSLIIMTVGSFGIIISVLFEWKTLGEGIVSGMFLTAVLLILGKIKYRTSYVIEV